jgi:hypothetical protein
LAKPIGALARVGMADDMLTRQQHKDNNKDKRNFVILGAFYLVTPNVREKKKEKGNLCSVRWK